MNDDEPCPCRDIENTLRSALEGHVVPACPRHSYGISERRDHDPSPAPALNSPALENHLRAAIDKTSQPLL